MQLTSLLNPLCFVPNLVLIGMLSYLQGRMSFMPAFDFGCASFLIYVGFGAVVGIIETPRVLLIGPGRPPDPLPGIYGSWYDPHEGWYKLGGSDTPWYEHVCLCFDLAACAVASYVMFQAAASKGVAFAPLHAHVGAFGNLARAKLYAASYLGFFPSLPTSLLLRAVQSITTMVASFCPMLVLMYLMAQERRLPAWYKALMVISGVGLCIFDDFQAVLQQGHQGWWHCMHSFKHTCLLTSALLCYAAPLYFPIAFRPKPRSSASSSPSGPLRSPPRTPLRRSPRLKQNPV